jgi:ABC-type multidrug transport system ATPase subunit
MDEAALCDRIALIQNGKILEIDTPKAIVKHFPKPIYNVRANNMYQLINSLKVYEYQHSVYPFGEFIHYTDNRGEFNKNDLFQYLESLNFSSIEIEQTEPTIEDTFMELAK